MPSAYSTPPREPLAQREPVLAGSDALAPSASPPSRGHLNKFAQNRSAEAVISLEPITTAVRVRPDVRAVVGRVRAEEGFPYADEAKLAALRQEDAQRAAIDCVTDADKPVQTCCMPVPLPARLSVLMCRHKRLGAACAEGMAQLPEELWLRVFAAARTNHPMPNVVELGPPPGSNATAGGIYPTTPPAAGMVAAAAAAAPPAAGEAVVPLGDVDPAAEETAHSDRQRRYGCGFAFGPGSTQEEVYESVGCELLESALEGYHSTILAYGQRGSGKTHTIEGGDVGDRSQSGLLQRAVRHAFLESNRRPGGELKIRLSCFAIHRSSIYDLLAPAPKAPAKSMIKRQDLKGERVPAFVDGLHAPPARTVEEAFTLVENARQARLRLPVCHACANWTREIDTFWTIRFLDPAPVTAGDMAAAAAPSPAGVVAAEGGGGGGGGGDAASKAAAVGGSPNGWRWLGSLTLVDLAGSGRRYHCSECAPEKGMRIHSVPSLSLVVAQLSDGKSRYVSYRDSHTTELLQDALGGRHKAAWLAHIIPGRDSMEYDETAGSLAMAQRVHKIRNRPQKLESLPPHGLAEEHSGSAEDSGFLAPGMMGGRLGGRFSLKERQLQEERELQELQQMLNRGKITSKRPGAPSSRAMAPTPSPPRAAVNTGVVWGAVAAAAAPIE